MQKMRKGDKVVVLTVRTRAVPAKSFRSCEEDRALVRGVNVVKRHQRQTQNQEAGIITKEASIHLSNIAIADPRDGKPTRVGFKIDGDKKVRVAKRSGDVIDG